MKRLTHPNIDDVFYRFHPEILVDFSADYHQETIEIIALIINKSTSIYKQLANDDIYVDDEGHLIKNHDDEHNIYLCHLYLLAYQGDGNYHKEGNVQFLLNHFLFTESLFYFDEHGYYRLFVKKHKTITHQFLLVGIGGQSSHGTQPFLDNIIYQDSIYQVCFSNLVLTYDGWFQGKFVWQNQSIHINMVIKVPSQILVKKLYPLLNDVLNH